MSAFSLDNAPPSLTIELLRTIDAPLPVTHLNPNHDFCISLKQKNVKTYAIPIAVMVKMSYPPSSVICLSSVHFRRRVSKYSGELLRTL